MGGTAPEAGGEAVLRFDRVSVRRPPAGHLVLHDVSWTVRAGEHWAVLGPNGAGKTSALRLASGLGFPTEGTVDVLGRRVGRVDVRELRAVVGSVASGHRLPESLTAHTAVLTGLTGTAQPLWKMYGDADRKRAGEVLEELGCAGLADREVGVCSEGEKARIRIARALMTRPSLLLLDEPFNALDLPSREDLVEALHALAERQPQLATVTVTHHVEELPPAVDHALLLRDGGVVAAGAVEEVLDSATLTRCFGRPITVARQGHRWVATSARG
ncbi:ABC transporter ATP-binding protein [Streptomyces sp. NPDC008001]|uniref:ABC transporter ATP-binding protein n=1 Tax=Streptomyces sp. NPDC008001 TaxID=3364804 RepID=UPI0036E9EEFC